MAFMYLFSHKGYRQAKNTKTAKIVVSNATENLGFLQFFRKERLNLRPDIYSVSMSPQYISFSAQKNYSATISVFGCLLDDHFLMCTGKHCPLNISKFPNSIGLRTYNVENVPTFMVNKILL